MTPRMMNVDTAAVLFGLLLLLLLLLLPVLGAIIGIPNLTYLSIPFRWWCMRVPTPNVSMTMDFAAVASPHKGCL
jgi:hypothetical protein